MNFDFTAWLTQLRAYYEGLEARQRRNVWLIGGILALSLILASVFLLNPSYKVVFSNLDAKSAGAITAKLSQMKIPYQLQGNNISVPAAEADKVRVDMAMIGLPTSGYVDYSQIFQSNTFGFSNQELNLQVLSVLQDRIAQSIESINGIENAQVNIVLPQQQTFIDPSMNLGAKASVLVTVGAGAALSQGQVAGIQQLVAHAVQGLNAANVSVVDQYGNDLSAQGGAVGTNSANPVSQELSTQLQVEQSLQNELQSSLIKMVGVGNVSVIVHANMTFNRVTTQSHQVVAGPPLSSQAASSSSTGGGSGTAAGGVAGQATQNPNIVTYGNAGNAGTSSSQRSATTNYDNSYVNTSTKVDPIQIQGYTVSVLINSSSVVLTKQLRQAVQSYVLTAIGSRGTTALSPAVTVLATPFAVGQGGVAAAASGTVFSGSYAIGAIAGLLLALGVIALVTVRARRRKRITTEAIGSLSVASLVNAPEETAESSMTRQLKELAARRPDAFAALLRSWLTDE